MPTNAKCFSERVNRCLDDNGAPSQTRERAIILSKMLSIPKQLAFLFLEGHQLPASDLVERIASEFEVDPQWLTGEK